MRFDKLMAWFGGRDLPVVSVCFGDTAVTAVWLVRHAGHYHMMAVACVPCTDAVAFGEITDKTKLAEAVSLAMSELGITDAIAIGCVPDNAVMTTSVKLPAGLSDDEIEAQILIDAERHLGRNPQEVYFDFQIDKHSPTATHINLTVAHRSSVDDCVEVLAMANLDTHAIDVHSACLVSWLTHINSQDAVAMIEIDTNQLYCCVVHRQTPLYQQVYPYQLLKQEIQVQPTDFGENSSKTTEQPPNQTLDFASFWTQTAGTPTDDVSNNGGDTDGYANRVDNLDWSDDLGDDALANQNLPTGDLLGANLPNDNLPTGDLPNDNLSNNDLSAAYHIRFDDELPSADNQATGSVQDLGGGDKPYQNDAQSDTESHAQNHNQNDNQAKPLNQTHISQMHMIDLSEKIAMMIEQYQLQHEPPIAQLYVSGVPTDDWANLPQMLTARLGVPCQFAHPSAVLADDEMMGVMDNATTKNTAMLTAATALAMRPTDGINLLPWREERRHQAYVRFRRLFIGVLASVLALILLVFGSLIYQTSQQTAINDEIKQRIDGLDDKLSKMQTMQTTLKQAQDQLQAIDRLAKDQQTLYRWQMLPSLVPSGVYLDTMKLTGDEITWTGLATDAQAVSAFASALELSGLYADVLVVSLQQVQSAMGFSITANQLPLDDNDMATAFGTNQDNHSNQDSQSNTDDLTDDNASHVGNTTNPANNKPKVHEQGAGEYDKHE
ncbi:pilus assembly protein PilM [Moraxella sp. ZJ142]|uniref:pilus assembly protein PilM n=1 Tax=Moraxella marmotae TaxID=3344520 RepID=UPI0035D52027